MPERLECEVLQKARYINTLTFTYTYLYPLAHRLNVNVLLLRLVIGYGNFSTQC